MIRIAKMGTTNLFRPAVSGFFSMFAHLVLFAVIAIVFAVKRPSMTITGLGVSYSFVSG